MNDIGSVLAVLRLGVLSFTILVGPLRGCCLWLLSLRAVTSNLSLFPNANPSQTEVWSSVGDSIKPSSFYNPTLSATSTHAVQICDFSLSAAASVQTVHVSVAGTSPFNGISQKAETADKEVRCSCYEFSKPIRFCSNLVETFFNPFPIRKGKKNWGSPCWFSRWRWSKFPWLHAHFRSGFFY